MTVLSVKLKFQERETEHYKSELEYYKNLLNQTGSILKGSVSTLTYVMSNYENAPVLMPIKGEQLNELETDKVKFCRLLISKYKDKTLKSFFGNFIIKLKKTENPQDQSLWNTDTNRLTFLIRSFMLDKTPKWMVDKDGRKTLDSLIIPLLNETNKLLTEYFYSNCQIKPNKTPIDYEYMMHEQNAISDIVTKIKDGTIANEILKFISPALNFKNNIKRIAKMDN